MGRSSPPYTFYENVEEVNSEYRWCFWPRCCYKTKRWIFCEVAVKQTVLVTPKADYIKHKYGIFVEIRWYKRHEWLILKLKGEV